MNKNRIVELNYVCPCCGYPKLDQRPYKNAPNPPYNLNHVKPPYEEHWGMPSYDVCDCCGFEYGFDDDTGVSVNSFENYLSKWVKEGCKWFSPEKKPDDWSLENQLLYAGLKLPGS